MTDINIHVKNGLRARDAVMAHRRDLNSASGLTVNYGPMSCPICKIGILHWHVMPNGHVHMTCRTKDCVEWVE